MEVLTAAESAQTPYAGSSVLQLTRPLVTLDLETTGVSVETNQIVSIALVKLTPEREVGTFS